MSTKGRLAAFAAALAGSAVLGLVAGLIWDAVAPRALLQEAGHGEAQYVNHPSAVPTACRNHSGACASQRKRCDIFL